MSKIDCSTSRMMLPVAQKSTKVSSHPNHRHRLRFVILLLTPPPHHLRQHRHAHHHPNHNSPHVHHVRHHHHHPLLRRRQCYQHRRGPCHDGSDFYSVFMSAPLSCHHHQLPTESSSRVRRWPSTAPRPSLQKTCSRPRGRTHRQQCWEGQAQGIHELPLPLPRNRQFTC